MNGIVRALTVYDDELIAGGDFTIAGRVHADRIARWDGDSWFALGGGMSGRVGAFAVYNGIALSPDGKVLYIVDNGAHSLHRYPIEYPGRIGGGQRMAWITHPDA